MPLFDSPESYVFSSTRDELIVFNWREFGTQNVEITGLSGQNKRFFEFLGSGELPNYD